MQEPGAKRWSVRPADSADVGFLRDMLHEAVFVPEGGPRPPRTVLELPELRRYVDGFGSRPGDLGVIGEMIGGIDGESGGELGAGLTGGPVGACWARQFPADAPGYGWVAADVPELSIAIAPGHRGLGLGSTLIEALCVRVRDQGHSRIGLSVDERSPARRLYERSGFVVVDSTDGSLTMIRDLE